MALIDRYLKTVRRHTGFRAVWPPSAPLAIGDVGRIIDGAFVHVTTLKRLGIAFSVTRDAVPADQFSFQSQGVRSIELKAKGTTNPDFKTIGAANAGIRVAFSSSDALVIKTKDVTVNRIADLATLELELLKSVRPGFADGVTTPPRWQRDWVVVTEVVDTGAATILASVGSDAAIELEADAGVGQADLVDVDAGLVATYTSSIGLEVVAKQGLTPFYRGVKVKRKWWWLWDDRVVPAGNTPPTDGDSSDLFDDSDTVDDDSDSASPAA